MTSMFAQVTDTIGGLWRRLSEETAGEGILPLLRPVPPFGGPQALSPVSSLAILLGLATLSGIALGAFGVLLAALLGIYVILSEVLGITVEVRPFRV